MSKSIKFLMIYKWLNEMGVKNYSINVDLTVDVEGSVNIGSKNLDEIPIQFGVVTREFSCIHNNITSLKGCPRKVGDGFYCYDNAIKSLEGCPEYVGKIFSLCSRDVFYPAKLIRGKIFKKKDIKRICCVGNLIYE